MKTILPNLGNLYILIVVDLISGTLFGRYTKPFQRQNVSSEINPSQILRFKLIHVGFRWGLSEKVESSRYCRVPSQKQP